MTDYEIIKTALKIARKAHAEQKDKAGDEYIFHPITVALLCDSAKAKAVALLHDTMEDCGVTYEEIREALGEEIADAVKLLTHDPSQQSLDDWLADYHAYVRGIKESGNQLAIEVKKADLTMNMDLSRIPYPTEYDEERIEKKYKPALEILDADEQTTK